MTCRELDLDSSMVCDASDPHHAWAPHFEADIVASADEQVADVVSVTVSVVSCAVIRSRSAPVRIIVTRAFPNYITEDTGQRLVAN